MVNGRGSTTAYLGLDSSVRITTRSLVVCVIAKVCLCLDGGWDSQGWSSSMTSSMQLAQECLKDPPETSEEPPAQLEGLEMFAQTIETGESKQSVSIFRQQNVLQQS